MNKRNSLPMPANHPKDCMSAATKCYKYLRRIFKFDQMDFEFAVWQMLYLFIAPQRVYRNFQYRKTSKSQFARDDPAFLVLFAGWLCVLGLGFVEFLIFLLYVIFVDCIGVGILIATIFWYVLNKYFRHNTNDLDVEWGYAFDVHLNAFFPPLVLLHFCQLFFVSSLFSPKFISVFFGNTFWLVACSYYVYITFLGYSSLHFLRRTQLILAPIPLLAVCYIISLTAGINITQMLVIFYKHRVV